MSPPNRLVDAVVPPGQPPEDAVVLRGYLGSSEDPRLGQLRARLAGSRGAAAKACLESLDAFFDSRDDAARIYLSARFDRYVDFHWTNDVIFVVPTDGRGQQTEDFSTTVWLRFRPNQPYVVVTRTPLEPSQRFVRGRLLDDFMAEPEAQTVWDEQTYAPTAAKPSKTYCTA